VVGAVIVEAVDNTQPLSSPLSGLDYYSLIRQRIEHEDNLVVQRLSWLVASQSFLFTAYAIVLNGLTTSPQPATATPLHQQMRLSQLIPLVAILTCALIYISIVAAVKAIAGLRRMYRSRFPSDETGLPGIQTDTLTRTLGLAAPLLLPLVFIGVWLYLSMQGLD
jgi:hypothetical protein